MKALIIGRFQPLHIGHLDLAKQIHEKGYELIIGIGDNGRERTKRYPFNHKEVKKMWEPYKEELKAKIFRIPDIPNDSSYAEHVENITGCNELDTVIVSGNKHTIDCFTKYNRNYKIITLERDLKSNFPEICGTKIRNLIKENKDWKSLLPKCTISVIENVDGAHIIKKLC